MSTRPDLNTYAYQRQRARLRAMCQRNDTPCQLCGQPIDWQARPKSRWAFSADHIDPVSLGGDLSLLQGTHAGCNSRKGNRVGTRSSRASRRW